MTRRVRRRRTDRVHAIAARPERRVKGNRSALYGAMQCDGANPEPQTMCSMMTPGMYSYQYDPIGSRTQTSQDGQATFYCANELNQSTATRGCGDSCPTPASPRESFIHDDDGNLTQDGTFTYTWGLGLSGQRAAGLSPRGASNGETAGLHAAGGIGGLLAVEETATTGTPKYWFLYDANGNVTQLVKNTTNYPLVAHYEYDAYGNAILASDVDSTGYVNQNPFRFSTKWLDGETGLSYYGFRFYSPAQARWINRDPVGELGGLNLYLLTTNDPINGWDHLGLIHEGSLDLPADEFYKWAEEKFTEKLKELVLCKKAREAVQAGDNKFLVHQFTWQDAKNQKHTGFAYVYVNVLWVKCKCCVTAWHWATEQTSTGRRWIHVWDLVICDCQGDAAKKADCKLQKKK